MADLFSHFLSPLTIRGKPWKNRSVAAPMGKEEIENGRLTDHAKEFIDFYAQGGTAEYIVGETGVNAQGSRELPGQFHSLWGPAIMSGLAECADRIHGHGALAMLELCHCGATKMADPDVPIVGPMEYIRDSDGPMCMP